MNSLALPRTLYRFFSLLFVYTSLPLSLSFPLCPSLVSPGRATYRADPLFLRAMRVCYTMPLQVENTDRLGINRSRGTERMEGKEEGKARVMRAARASNGWRSKSERARGPGWGCAKSWQKEKAFLLFFSVTVWMKIRARLPKKFNGPLARVYYARVGRYAVATSRSANKNSSVQSRSLNVSLEA